MNRILRAVKMKRTQIMPVQTAIEKLVGEDERTKAMKEMFAVAESREFANDFKDFDEWLKTERKTSEKLKKGLTKDMFI